MDIFYGPKSIFRRWSAWLVSLALGLLSVVIYAPDAIVQTWAALPEAVKERLPVWVIDVMPLWLMIASLAAQAVKQEAVKVWLSALGEWLTDFKHDIDGKASRKWAASGGLVALVGAAAAGILMNIVPEHEGVVNKGYRDPVGIPTKCVGDTTNVVLGRVYTDEECRVSLDTQLIAHAKPVIACTPQIKDNPYVLAAAIDLAYNIGTHAYCKSTVANRFRAGRIRDGCDGMLAWVYAKGRKLPGLVKRREANRALCLRGV